MNDHRDPPPASGSAQSPEGRLDSWKEIAVYLGRGIRTVQRWERDEGLPVHRLAHEKRGSVYARREELAAWWESRRVALTSPPMARIDETTVVPRVERVTRTSAATFWPALSSDGRMIAYTSDAGQDGLAPQIWLQQIGGGAVRLTTGQREYSQLSFSSDDTRIVFTAVDDAGQNVYQIPTLGGEARLLQRAASCARYSPDGRWLASVSIDAAGVRIVARDGTGSATIASGLLDVSCAVWSPDSRAAVVHARPAPELEADWWIAPVDGRPPTNTGIIRRLREEGFYGVPDAVVWVDESIVYSATVSEERHLYRERIAPSTFEVSGAREQLTIGHEFASYPAAAGGRLAFVSSHLDANLWSVAVDAASGVAQGPLRRMTRGPGIAGFLSATADSRTLAYFSTRLGAGDVFLRTLDTGSETVTVSPPGGRGYPAISPRGNQLAYGTRVPGDRTMRPIFIECLRDGTSRRLGEDCGGRPRQWVDERLLVIERFARLNVVGLIDTVTGQQRALLESTERSVKNPRLSPDGKWIAFDAARPGESSSVLIAPLGQRAPIPESEWVMAGRSASHPFWSADGRLLYYLPTGGHAPVRSLVVKARYISPESRLPEGEPIAVYGSREMMMPAFLSGATPIATAEQITFVLGDFRGDVWVMELEPRPSARDE